MDAGQIVHVLPKSLAPLVGTPSGFEEGKSDEKKVKGKQVKMDFPQMVGLLEKFRALIIFCWQRDFIYKIG